MNSANKRKTFIISVIIPVIVIVISLGFQTVAGVVLQSGLQAGGHRVVNVASPINSNDVATKSYVNSLAFIDGSGTTNYLPRWSDSNTLVNSIIQDNGTYVGIGVSPDSQYRLKIDGNISATSYYGDGSHLTGISGLWADAGSYIYAKNATNVVITDSGNVGIGETSPSYKLDVNGEMRVDGAIYARDSSGVGLRDQYGNLGVWVESGGYVGIGTANPNYNLDVNGSLRAGIYYQNGTQIWGSYWKKSGSDIYYNPGISGGGQVGIGTSNPVDLLHVVGNINGYDYYQNGSKLGMWKKESTWSDNIYYNAGRVAIGKTSPSYGCDLDVAGRICGSTKNFVIPHPTKPGMKLVHSSLEGQEAAVFYRGEGQLQNGQAIIELPDYFEALTRKEGRTVQITPLLDSVNQQGTIIGASAVTNNQFKVKAADNNNPFQKFYWEVKALRADTPILEVEK